MNSDFSNIRLITTDLDGTLALLGKEVNPQIQTALEKACKKGYILHIATGRPLSLITNDLLGLKGLKYITYANGAKTIRFSDKSTIDSKNIKKEGAIEILKLIKEFNLEFGFFVDGIPLFSEKFMFTKTPEVEVYNPNAPNPLLPFHVDYNLALNTLEQHLDLIQQINLNFEDMDLRQNIFDKVNTIMQKTSYFSTTTSFPYNIEITPFQISKASGIQKVCELEGITSENVIAFGDGGNDIEMLNFAQIGVAVKDSTAYKNNPTKYTIDPPFSKNNIGSFIDKWL